MPGKPIPINAASRKERLNAVADQIACPVCLGNLGMEIDRLVCAQCGRSYPVVDGIPVLIPAQ